MLRILSLQPESVNSKLNCRPARQISLGPIAAGQYNCAVQHPIMK